MNPKILKNIQQVQKNHSTWRNHLKSALDALPVNSHRKLALVVDDDPLVLRSLRPMLEAHNYAVMTASTGRGAIQSIKTVVPKLIVLDLMLPDINGDEVFKFIRSHPASAEVPVIFMSGTITPTEEKTLNKTEPESERYLSKPFEPDKLFQLAERLLPVILEKDSKLAEAISGKSD